MERKRKIIEHQTNKEKRHLQYKYDMANPAKQIKEKSFKVFQLNMDKVKTFRNLASDMNFTT